MKFERISRYRNRGQWHAQNAVGFQLLNIFAKTSYYIPSNIYLFKVNNRNTRKRCEICAKLTIKTQERRHSGVFIVNFEHISNFFLVFLLLNLNKELLAGYLAGF